MIEENFKTIAQQLRKPHGIGARETGRRMNKVNQVMNLETIDRLNIKSSDSILKIGMGNGFFVKYILSAGRAVKYCGCDFSGTMVREATMYNKDFVKNGQAQFNYANANRLPYNTGHFDKVFTVNTIYFWDDIGTALSEIYRVLKKNGMLIISLRPRSVMDNFPITKYGFRTYSKMESVELLTQSGFKIVNVTERQEPDIEFFDGRFPNGFMIIQMVKQK